MIRMQLSRSAGATTLACLLGLVLTACGGGGGGGNTRPTPPPAAPPPTPPTTPPVVLPPNPAYGSHLLLTNTAAAHAAGFTGQGVTIGVVDSGINRNHPALAGRVLHNLNYVSSPPNNLAVDDVVGHGTAVSQILAGKPFGSWPGGIAPGANLVSARIISDRSPTDDGSGNGNEVNGALGLAPIHRDLIARGVRIMNNSWGGLYWTNPAATIPIANEYRDFIFANDGLVVFAAGNESRADPSNMAALPSQPGVGGTLPAADLERGWLVAVALDTDNPTQLASYSNACGLAMNYCLAAPGKVVTTGINDAPASPTYWSWSGTSLAAPQVSGAAALVWQAFPYFNNDLVRQTLLGTATDLGASGVDPVFGYGALNVGRAVNGPSRFDWGDVTADFNGITSVWGNTISGDGGLIKQGSGTLVLGGYNDYLGDTRVLGGTLRLGGVLENSSVHVGGGATLSGDAWVKGDLENLGTLALDGGADMSIGGNYVHGPDARLAILLPRSLYIDGTATIQGGDLHVLGLVTGYVAAQQEDVLIAYAGVSGRFNGLSAAPGIFLQAALGYDANRIWLDITRLDVTAAVKSLAQITPAASSSAQRIENAFTSIDAQNRAGTGNISEGFIDIAGKFQQLGDESAAVAALSSLSGEAHTRAMSLTFETIGMGRRALSSRLDDLEGWMGRVGAWKQSLGRGGPGGFAGGDLAMDGWMMGRDQPVGEHGVAGFAFGQTRVADQFHAGGDRNRDRQTQARFYAGSLHGNAYMLAQYGFGRFDRDVERSLFAGESRDRVASRYSGSYGTVGAEAGLRFGSGNARLTPYVGAEYTRLDSDGFNEPGANGFGLKAHASTASQTQAIAGMRAEYTLRGLTLRSYAEWQQPLAVDGSEVEASFTGVEAWSPLPAWRSSQSGGLFGLGADAWLTRNSVLSFGYDQRFGPHGNERQLSATFGLGF